MIKSFKSKALADLWATGRTAKIAAKIHKRVLVRLDRLDVSSAPEQMNLPGFDFHPLKGFKRARYAVRLNGPWCITFEFNRGEAVRVDFEQYY